MKGMCRGQWPVVDGQASLVVCVYGTVDGACLFETATAAATGLGLASALLRGLAGLGGRRCQKKRHSQSTWPGLRKSRPCAAELLVAAHKKSPSLPRSCFVSAWVVSSSLPAIFSTSTPRVVAVRMGTGKKEAARKTRQGKVGDGMANVKVKGENFYRCVRLARLHTHTQHADMPAETQRRSRSSTSSPKALLSATLLVTSQKPPSSSRVKGPRPVSSPIASGSPTLVSSPKMLCPPSVAPSRLSRMTLTRTCSSRTSCL